MNYNQYKRKRQGKDTYTYQRNGSIFTTEVRNSEKTI